MREQGPSQARHYEFENPAYEFGERYAALPPVLRQYYSLCRRIEEPDATDIRKSELRAQRQVLVERITHDEILTEELASFVQFANGLRQRANGRGTRRL